MLLLEKRCMFVSMSLCFRIYRRSMFWLRNSFKFNLGITYCIQSKNIFFKNDTFRRAFFLCGWGCKIVISWRNSMTAKVTIRLMHFLIRQNENSVCVNSGGLSSHIVFFSVKQTKNTTTKSNKLNIFSHAHSS